MAENQVDNLVKKAEELEKALDSARSGPNARALGGGSPTAVAFPTAYKLTEEQEKELVESKRRKNGADIFMAEADFPIRFP